MVYCAPIGLPLTQSDQLVTDTLIKCKNLLCERDNRVLFNALSFEVQAGQILQVAGANGAGKTTLLRLMAGLYGNYDGHIRWPNAHACDESPQQHFLYLGHRAGLRDELSAIENLRWWCALHYCSDQGIDVALAKVGLAGYEDVAASSLSAGQRRRVMLALLWVAEKPVWLLDEPFTALDQAAVELIEARIKEHAESGGAVVYSSHHRLAGDVTHLHLGGQAQMPEDACS